MDAENRAWLGWLSVAAATEPVVVGLSANHDASPRRIFMWPALALCAVHVQCLSLVYVLSSLRVVCVIVCVICV
jgi:hypothetical protein